MNVRGLRDRLASASHRLVVFADEPTDDDDTRLRKRVGVFGGYVNILLALNLPVIGQGSR